MLAEPHLRQRVALALSGRCYPQRAEHRLLVEQGALLALDHQLRIPGALAPVAQIRVAAGVAHRMGLAGILGAVMAQAAVAGVDRPATPERRLVVAAFSILPQAPQAVVAGVLHRVMETLEGLDLPADAGSLLKTALMYRLRGQALRHYWMLRIKPYPGQAAAADPIVPGNSGQAGQAAVVVAAAAEQAGTAASVVAVVGVLLRLAEQAVLVAAGAVVQMAPADAAAMAVAAGVVTPSAQAAPAQFFFSSPQDTNHDNLRTHL